MHKKCSIGERMNFTGESQIWQVCQENISLAYNISVTKYDQLVIIF